MSWGRCKGKCLQAYLNDAKAIRASSAESLGEILAKFDGYLVQSKRVREKLHQDLVANERDILMYKERVIRNHK